MRPSSGKTRLNGVVPFPPSSPPSFPPFSPFGSPLGTASATATFGGGGCRGGGISTCGTRFGITRGAISRSAGGGGATFCGFGSGFGAVSITCGGGGGGGGSGTDVSEYAVLRCGE